MEKENAESVTSVTIRYTEQEGLYFINSRGSIERFELIKDGRENVMAFSMVSRHLRWLQGEILTILEATIDDERKLKATKQLVKDKISSKISWIYEQCGCPEKEQEGLSEPEEDKSEGVK